MKKELGFSAVGAIIMVVVVALIGIVAWRVWEANRIPQAADTSQKDNKEGSQKNIFKIHELGVEFDVKDGVGPLYSVATQEWQDTSYRSVVMSTQEVVAQGSQCSFPGNSGVGFTLMKIFIYDSIEDVLKVENDVTPDEVTTTNGYITVDRKIYHIPQGVQSGQGVCMDGEFESQQRTSLRNSLMTLKATR